MFEVKKGPLRIWDITNKEGIIIHVLYFQGSHILAYYDCYLVDIIISNEACYTEARILGCYCLSDSIRIESLDKDNTYVNNLQIDDLRAFYSVFDDNTLDNLCTYKIIDSLDNQLSCLSLVDLGITKQSGGTINSKEVRLLERELILYRSPGIISKWIFNYVSINGNSLCVSIREVDLIYILPEPLLDSQISNVYIEKIGTKQISYIPEDKFEYDSAYKISLLGRICDESIVEGVKMKEKIQSHKHELVGAEKYVNQIVEEINKFQIGLNKIKDIFKNP